jgi:hypothetical protein
VPGATFDTTVIYPLRLDKRESRVVEVAIANANGATKVANDAARLALSPNDGDIVSQLDNHLLYIWNAGTSTWVEITSGGGGGTPAGSTGQVQFNNAGSFAADAKFGWDNSGKQLNLNGLKVEPLSSLTLLNNQSSVVILTDPERFFVVEYSIERSGDVRVGQIKLGSNGVVTTIDDIFVNTSDVGVTFSAVVNGSNVELLATTTNLGTSATMKYSRRKWS